MNQILRSSWIPKKLYELGFVGRGKSRHRPRNDLTLYGGPYPFIQTADIMASVLHITKYSQTYSEKGLAQSKLWNENTLCMTIAGENTAETAILSFKACFPDSIVGFIAYPDKANVYFVKYYLDTIKQQLKNVSRGATQDNLSLDKLFSFDILTPSLSTQRKIAAILSAYDDLIENNTRRITILEEMAQALYREWFVHFRYPGHEKNGMMESALGMIPEGWEVVKLGDALTLQRGFDLPTAQRQDGNIPVYAATGINGTHNVAKVKGPGVVTGRSGSLGTVIYITENFWPLNTTLWVKDFRLVTPIYAFYLLSFIELKTFNSGVAVPTLNRNDVHKIQIVIPPCTVIDQFDRYVLPMFTMKKYLTQKNTNLRQTRDLLLPKLISGEVDVEGLDIETGEGMSEAIASIEEDVKKSAEVALAGEQMPLWG